MPNGLGDSVLPVGDLFQGSWRDGMRDGFGKLDGEYLQYRGGFEAGHFTGYGKLVHGQESESRYQGWFQGGKKSGWGHANFETLKCRGYFQDDVPHGHCTESVLLEGVWHECRAQYWHGNPVWRRVVGPANIKGSAAQVVAAHASRLKLEHGSQPQSTVEAVLVEGHRTYIGETIKSKIEGLGIESVEIEDGTCELYAGRFCNGVRQGHGVILRAVGDFYIGSFENGQPHGIGFDLSRDMYYAGEMQVSACHLETSAQLSLFCPVCLGPNLTVKNMMLMHDSLGRDMGLGICQRWQVSTT